MYSCAAVSLLSFKSGLSMLQFDMIKAMPGGVKRLKAIGDQLHRRGIRGLWPGKHGTLSKPLAQRWWH
jgi:hypothetical protein